MRAVLFEDGGTVRVGDHPEPSIAEAGDAIVRVDTAAICGSDLHLLHGRIPGMATGTVMGHEFVGRIEAVGDGVRGLVPGQRVVGSFLIACGACWFCERDEFNRCERMWALGYGLFLGNLDGAQAELVRVPDAEVNLRALADDMTDEQAIFAGDILSTGAYAVAEGGVRAGDVVAIIGAGPVGLFAAMHARATSPAEVLLVDVAPDRLAMAERVSAVPVDASAVNPVVEIQRRTGERGADVVIEAVGTNDALTTALDAARPGGTVVVIGVTAELSYDLPIGEVWRRGLRIVMGGTCNVQAHWGRALDLVARGEIDPTIIISHTLPLEEAVKGYELFESRQAVKVLLTP